MPAHGGARTVATCVWAAAPAPAVWGPRPRWSEPLPPSRCPGASAGLQGRREAGASACQMLMAPRPPQPGLSRWGTADSRTSCTWLARVLATLLHAPLPRILAPPPFLAALSLEGSRGSQQQAQLFVFGSLLLAAEGAARSPLCQKPDLPKLPSAQPAVPWAGSARPRPWGPGTSLRGRPLPAPVFPG